MATQKSKTSSVGLDLREYSKFQFKIRKETENDRVTHQRIMSGALLRIADSLEKISTILTQTQKQEKEFIQKELAPTVDELILELRINDCRLSVRVLNCLQRSEIKTIKDLLGYSEYDLLKIRNMGVGCLKEIQELLFGMKLHLKPNE